LSKADKKAIKSELCKKLGKTKDQRKFIDPQDAALDQGFDFGKEFFFEKTLDPDVLAAVKKSARVLKEESVYGLLGYLQKNNETQACDYFQTKLSQKAKLHICEMIYNRRAKHAGSLFFQSAESNIKDLEDIVLQRLQVLTQMQQTVSEERKKEIKEIDAHLFKYFISDENGKTA